MQNFENNTSIIALKPNEIHLWFAFPDEIQNTDLLSTYKQIMIPEEAEKQQRFYFPKHRHQYLVARALVRTTLSRYTGIEPRLLEFLKNHYGRPEVILPERLPPIRFNISHTDGLIACAVVLKQDIGVDVEDIMRREVSLDLANRFFSEKEVNSLQQLPKDKMWNRFYDYWTLKESYIKARGMGLSIPLDQFSFHISEQDPLRISFDPSLKDIPNHWKFWLLKPTDRHKVAISIFNETECGYSLFIRKVVPLMEEYQFDCEILRR